MQRAIQSIFIILITAGLSGLSNAQYTTPPLPHSDTILLTVFLKHDQTMNNDQRRELLEETGFFEHFPPEGVEIVNRYVMMGIGQVIVMRMPPELLRRANVAIERGAWGSFQTEFYITYDLAEAIAAQQQ